ncbi:hypothetical protein [Curtobacterium sp. MCBD17_040]|uniref:hypothetical protein n=1 Tax=Curtobacterium sp. MCBD17_040 TaxID=2175674 RepID=UPI000DA90645|nr:hypothetical protein [Curtobacterium sp. MCBD17_040]WIB65429.1 hypothetical protein DEI94_18660 [Curtobacterium sp. MCBD17_040]
MRRLSIALLLAAAVAASVTGCSAHTAPSPSPTAAPTAKTAAEKSCTTPQVAPLERLYQRQFNVEATRNVTAPVPAADLVCSDLLESAGSAPSQFDLTVFVYRPTSTTHQAVNAALAKTGYAPVTGATAGTMPASTYEWDRQVGSSNVEDFVTDAPATASYSAGTKSLFPGEKSLRVIVEVTAPSSTGTAQASGEGSSSTVSGGYATSGGNASAEANGNTSSEPGEDVCAWFTGIVEDSGYSTSLPNADYGALAEATEDHSDIACSITPYIDSEGATEMSDREDLSLAIYKDTGNRPSGTHYTYDGYDVDNFYGTLLTAADGYVISVDTTVDEDVDHTVPATMSQGHAFAAHILKAVLDQWKDGNRPNLDPPQQ